jgi:murein DD-endopeptidase MepM/ murein hydrolase activator NlpD
VVPVAAAAIASFANTGAGLASGAPADLALQASVAPRQVYFGASRELSVSYRFHSPKAADIQVRLRRTKTGRIVWGALEPQAASRTRHVVSWPGLTWAGKPAAEGEYAVLVGEQGGPLRVAGRFTLWGHFFPVRGPHGTRGPIGDFGAPRSGGRTHEGFDVTAACGTELDAVRAGRVLRQGYDPVLYGNYVLIHGRGETRSYFYAHMIRPALVAKGDDVLTGQRVGSVGKTGNARTTRCHLHFEIHVHGHPIDPEPALRRWDRSS